MSHIPSAYFETVEDDLDSLSDVFTDESSRIPIRPEKVNDLFHGLRDEMVLVYGRTGVGKTDFGINLALGASERARIVYVSIELPKRAILKRLVPLESTIIDFNLRFTADEISHIADLPREAQQHLFFVISMAKEVCRSLTIVDGTYRLGDSAYFTIEEIRRAIRKLREKLDDVVVVIDYLQLLRTEELCNNATERLDRISRTIADLAHSESVPIIVLSAVGKDGKIRGSEMPWHDSDIVLKLVEDDDRGDHRTVHVDVEKNRDGSKGSSVDLTYLPAYHVFY